MKIGIFFFSFMKMFQGTTKPKLSPRHYILISDNEEKRKKIEAKLNLKVVLQKTTESFQIHNATEIIFDSNYLDFKTIIKVFETNKNNHFTLKILSKSADFIIGSDSSFDRGEIILI
jgi:hypothetical protein